MSAALLQNVGLKPSLARAAKQKARREGKTPPEYVRSLIERDLLADKNFDEMLKPVRADFRSRGITEDELDQIVERAQVRRLVDVSAG